jgi:hypothetical protein
MVEAALPQQADLTGPSREVAFGPLSDSRAAKKWADHRHQIARPGRQSHGAARPISRARNCRFRAAGTWGEYIQARRMALKVGTTFNIQNL